MFYAFCLRDVFCNYLLLCVACGALWVVDLKFYVCVMCLVICCLGCVVCGALRVVYCLFCACVILFVPCCCSVLCVLYLFLVFLGFCMVSDTFE